LKAYDDDFFDDEPKKLPPKPEKAFTLGKKIKRKFIFLSQRYFSFKILTMKIVAHLVLQLNHHSPSLNQIILMMILMTKHQQHQKNLKNLKHRNQK